MKKFVTLALLLAIGAAPAFARFKKPHKDSRFAEHPKAFHPKNEQFKHAAKHKVAKHKAH
ncbi:MAG TPA: hypothetical protein VGF82_19960 [Terracidiphilus sp.]